MMNGQGDVGGAGRQGRPRRDDETGGRRLNLRISLLPMFCCAHMAIAKDSFF